MSTNEITIKRFTDQKIIDYSWKRCEPCISASGDAYVVCKTAMFIDGNLAKIMSITDVNAFASEDAAYAHAAKMTSKLHEAGSSIKHAYTVECRHIDF